MTRIIQDDKIRHDRSSFNILNNKEISDIHRASLEILEKEGVLVESVLAIEILDAAGALVDKKSSIVKFPSGLIEGVLGSCPSKVALYGRLPKNDVTIGNDKTAFSNLGGALNLVDPQTDLIRPSTKKDLAASALLVDYLDEINIYKVALNACDVPQSLLYLHHAAITFANTSKPFYTPGGDAYQIKKIIEMATAVAGSPNKLAERPILIISACPVSPLKLPETTCDIIMACARSKIPCSATSMALAGATAPVTTAGALVLQNAEVLASYFLHQATTKGAPFLYGSVTTLMDLRFATPSYGSPAMAMIGAAVAQLARYYGLPSNVGGGSDSKVSDRQAAHEITFTALLPALARASIITGAGCLEMGSTLSFGQMVSDCDFYRMIRQSVEGIPVRDETLAVNVVRDVGFSKDYLCHEHTLKHMHASQIKSGLIDRRRREDWQKNGSKDMGQIAKEKARHILTTHKPEPLPESVSIKIREIIKEAEKELKLYG